MVSTTDYISSLFKYKSGLTEAILIPQLTLLDLVRVSSLNHATRNLFLPQSSHHINYIKVFCAKLGVDESSEEESLALRSASEISWFALLKTVAEFSTRIRLMPY